MFAFALRSNHNIMEHADEVYVSNCLAKIAGPCWLYTGTHSTRSQLLHSRFNNCHLSRKIKHMFAFNVLDVHVFELTISTSFSSKSACDRASCENGGTCQSGFTDKGYQCVCLPGFTSAHCEKGISNSTVTRSITFMRTLARIT